MRFVGIPIIGGELCYHILHPAKNSGGDMIYMLCGSQYNMAGKKPRIVLGDKRQWQSMNGGYCDWCRVALNDRRRDNQ